MAMATIAASLVGPLSGLLSEFIEDKDKRNEMAHKVATMAATQAHTETMAQLEVNKVEAAHKSLFVAGWRPAIGWICGLAMFNNYVVAGYFDVAAIELGEMMPVLLGMLGLGGMRSYEKTKGVAREK